MSPEVEPTLTSVEFLPVQPLRPEALGGIALPGAMAVDSAADVVSELHEVKPEIEERLYQVECLDALDKTRESGEQRALIHMATGLGKTTVAAVDVMRFCEDHPGARTLFLCHRNYILGQARQRFQQILGDEHTTGKLTAKSTDAHQVSTLFASFQMMANRREDFDPEEFDYIIVDEGHHGKADTYEPTLEYFKPKFLLGLTATPDRADPKNIRDIFGHEVYSKTLAEALADSLLAHPDYRVIMDDIDEEALRELLKEEGLSISDINKRVFIPRRDEEIIRIVQEKITEKGIENPRIIGFCASIEHAERISTLLPRSKPLHSKIKGKEARQQLFEEFHAGETEGMITVDMFNEGVDVPDANVILFLRNTDSETIFLQQLGRGLRKTADKDEVLVLDFAGNCDRLLMVENLLYGATRSKLNGKPAGAELDDPDDIDLYDLDFKDIEDAAELVRELDLGNFEFNESTRKILEIIRKIQGEGLPENWVSIKKIIIETGISRQILQRAMQDFEWQPKTFPRGNRQVLAIDPKQAAELLEHPLVNVGELPEGAVLLREFCTANNITYTLVNRIIGDLDIQLPICFTEKNGRRTRSQYLTGEIQNILLSQEVVSTQSPPEGHLSINGFAKKLGISPTTVAKIVGELGLDLPKYKYGPKIAPSLDSEVQEMILDHTPELRLEPIPEGYASVTEFAKRLGVTYGTLKDELDELGLELEVHRVKGHSSKTLSPDAQAIVLGLPRFSIEAASEDMKSVYAFASELGVAKPTLLGLAKELGMEVGMYKFGGRPAPGLSAAQQQSLSDAVEFRRSQVPPESAMTLNGIEMAYGIKARKIKRVIGELGIRSFQAYDSRMKQANFYTSDDIEFILAHIDDN